MADTAMKISLAPQVLEKFPDAAAHGAIFDRLDLIGQDVADAWWHRPEGSLLEGGMDFESLAEMPVFQEWRAAFKQFGLKPSKYRSSIEQLYRRTLKGGRVSAPLASVNLYCYVSMLARAPMGGYDLRKTRGDISIRLTEGGEEFTPVGDESPSPCKPGVVVYADDAGVICYAWNYRDAARTCLDENTRKAIFFADAVSKGGQARAQEAVEMLSAALAEAGGIRLSVFSVDRERKEVEVTI